MPSLGYASKMLTRCSPLAPSPRRSAASTVMGKRVHEARVEYDRMSKYPRSLLSFILQTVHPVTSHEQAEQLGESASHGTGSSPFEYFDDEGFARRPNVI